MIGLAAHTPAGGLGVFVAKTFFIALLAVLVLGLLGSGGYYGRSRW